MGFRFWADAIVIWDFGELRKKSVYVDAGWMWITSGQREHCNKQFINKPWNDPHLFAFKYIHRSFFSWTWVGLASWWTEYGTCKRMQVLRHIKRLLTSFLATISLSWITDSTGNQLPCCEESPSEKHEVNEFGSRSSGRLPTNMWRSLEAYFLSSVESWDD